MSAGDLTGFLKARLDEDESEARAKMEDACPSCGSWGVAHACSGIRVVGGPALHPARLLREVEAQRAILAEHAPGYPVTYPEPSGRPTCGVCHAGGWDWDPHAWPCPTVRLLAAIYSDHPDYREEWEHDG